MMPSVYVSMESFEAAVQAALESIPSRFQPYLEHVEVVIKERSRAGLFGQYHGVGALNPGGGLPDRITIYKSAHEDAAGSWEDLVAEVRRTILHEVGHHFGMAESELPF